MTPEQRWRTLARRVAQRRDELGLSYTQIAAKGGPSRETVRSLERRTAPPTVKQRRSLDALDRALGWEAGTSWRIVTTDDHAPKPASDDNIVTFLLARIAEDEVNEWLCVDCSAPVADERRLAECAAKRRCIQAWEFSRHDVALVTLRIIAAVYSDHPDYNPDWRP